MSLELHFIADVGGFRPANSQTLLNNREAKIFAHRELESELGVDLLYCEKRQVRDIESVLKDNRMITAPATVVRHKTVRGNPALEIINAIFYGWFEWCEITKTERVICGRVVLPEDFNGAAQAIETGLKNGVPAIGARKI